MNKATSFGTSLIKKLVESTLSKDVKRTTCSAIYQPKAPASLDKFKKNTSDDK